MACGERPIASDILTSATTANPVASQNLTWYRRLHASYSRHRHLEPLQENDRLSSDERTAPGSSATSRQTGTKAQVKFMSSNKSRSGKTNPRAPSKEGVNPKKENSDAARRRLKETLSNSGKHHRNQRMSYPPCTKPSQTDEWASLPTSEETNSCPVLCDLENLTITPKKPSSKSSLSLTQPSTSEQATIKDTTHQHKTKSDSVKRQREHERLRVADSTNTRSRHVKSRKPREDSKSQRPKPPSWQDIPHDQPTANAAQEPVATHAYSIPESVHSIPAFRCDSATTRSTVDSDRRAMRANIRRTRSRIIDTKEIPEAETVLPLSQTKPHEFNLRKTYHDDTVYLLENAQRCRKWLAAVKEADVTPHFDESGNSDSIKTLEDKEEIVTCDMEISQDKWDFLGSPYQASICSSSEDE